MYQIQEPSQLKPLREKWLSRYCISQTPIAVVSMKFEVKKRTEHNATELSGCVFCSAVLELSQEPFRMQRPFQIECLIT